MRINNDLNHAKEESLSSLSHSASILEEIMLSEETQIFYLLRNSQVEDFVESHLFYQNVPLTLNLADQVSVFKNNNDLLQKVCIYSKNMEGIFSNDLGFVRDNSSVLFEDKKLIESLPKSCGWVHPSLSAPDNQIIFYWKLPMTQSNVCDGIAAFYFSGRQILRQTLEMSDKFSDTVFYVLNENNDVLMCNYGTSAKRINRDALDTYVAKKLSYKNATAYFEEKIDNVDVMLSVVKGNSGRLYVSILEKKLLLSGIYSSARMFVVVLLLAVAACAVLSLFWSRQIYSPIKSLVMQFDSIDTQKNRKNSELAYIRECFDSLWDEIRDLNSDLFEMQIKLRDDLLVTLLKEPQPYNSEFYKKCEIYSLNSSYEYIVLAVFPINAADLGRLKNLLTEITYTPKSEDHYILANDSDHITVIMSFLSSVNAQYLSTLNQFFANKIVEHCKANGVDVYVGIGDVCSQLNNLYYSYQNALLNALEFTHNTNKRIFCEHKVKIGIQPTTITSIHECAQRMRNHFEASNTSAAAEELDKFIDSLTSTESVFYTLQALKLLFFNLVLTKFGNMHTSISSVLDQNDFYILEHCRNITEIREWFISTLMPMLKKPLDQIGEYEKIIPRICTHIQENIYKDITLNNCADIVNVTPGYLSKLFKKEMQMSFVDYVSICKVREVEKLLASTELSISTIAEKIGYSSRNLYRVFFKVTGMSPNEYRVNRAVPTPAQCQ